MPILCAFIAYPMGRKYETARDYFVIAVTFLELVLSFGLAVLQPQFTIGGCFANGLHFTTDGFRVIYGILTAVMWAGTTLFAKEYFLHEREKLASYWFFILVTLGATEGVMLSADLMTSFVFFEVASFTSFVWVIHEETEEAVNAGYTYLFIAVIGGLVLFMGLLLLQQSIGTLQFSELRAAVEASDQKGMVLAAGICILFGFGAKAGMFPLHVWLPKAHPVAPSPASALLSGILTKVGVYGVLMTSLEAMLGNLRYGALMLFLAVITMVLGAVLGVFSVNLKRTLACSSMSQIGFILTGISMAVLTAGREGEAALLAESGAMLHMVNHSLIKLALFMCAGVVVMNLHKLDLNEIRGWGRNKWLLKISFALGALGISGIPIFNGFISKTLLHEGIAEAIHVLPQAAGLLHMVEWVFLFSGGLTFAYMLKLFICIFIEKNADPAVQAEYDRPGKYMNLASKAAIFGSALFMVILGQPAVMTRLAAYMTGEEEILHFHAFTWVNIKGGLISLVIGAAVYLLIIRKLLIHNNKYINVLSAKMDMEVSLYRPMIRGLILFFEFCASVGRHFHNGFMALIWILAYVMQFLFRFFEDGMDGLVVLMRISFARENPVKGSQQKKLNPFYVLWKGTVEAIHPLVSGFTFSLFMTCGGILVILGVLVITML